MQWQGKEQKLMIYYYAVCVYIENDKFFFVLSSVLK